MPLLINVRTSNRVKNLDGAATPPVSPGSACRHTDPNASDEDMEWCDSGIRSPNWMDCTPDCREESVLFDLTLLGTVRNHDS